MPTLPTLPAGLTYHCSECQLVVPADAPRPTPDDANCAWVKQHKLSWLNPAETLAGQHVMATATDHLIYRRHLQSATPDPSVTEYHRSYRAGRKAHFNASLARQAMTEQQIAQAAQHKRDAWLYR